jgi:hypothetical protein
MYRKNFHIPGTENTTRSSEEFAQVTFVKNFTVDKGLRRLSGRYFVIDTEETSFFHFLFYHLGQFLLLKNIFPDIKLLICISREILPPYVDILVKLIDKKYSPDYFNYKSSHNGIIIEELAFISNRLIPIVHNSVESAHEDLISLGKYAKAISKLLRLFIHEHVYPMPSEKIFITRRDVSDRTRQYRLVLDIMPKLGIVWNSKDRVLFDTYGIYPMLLPGFAPGDIMPWHLEPEANFRYLSERDENYLENFFLDRGYRILDPGKEDLLQTLSSVFNSTHCAALAGSVVFNFFAAGDETILFLINQDTRFEFDYNTAIDSISDNVFHVFDRRVDDSERKCHDIDDVIDTIIKTGKV